MRLVAACTLAGAMAIAGCGQERSAAAYCETYKDGFAEIKREYPDIDQYERGDPLRVLLTLPSALGDITALISDMAEAAPEEIAGDVERVHENFEQQLDSVEKLASDPLAGALGALTRGLTDAGAFARTDAFTVEHCGEHMFSASPQT